MTWRLLLLASLAAFVGVDLLAQTAGPEPEVLRRDVDRRFDVFLLRDGVVLRPKSSNAGVRSVEVNGGAVAVDGTPVTGAELRAKLGGDADLVMQLSYLDPQRLRMLFTAAGQPGSPTTAPPAENRSVPETRARRRGGDRIRFGGNVTVGEDEVVNGDIVAIGGAVRIDGQVLGDAVAIGGGITLGPKADVSGDVVAVGGGLQRDPAARIGGDVQEVGWGSGRVGGLWGNIWRGMVLGATFALVATLARVSVLCLLAALVVLLGRDYVERISASAAAEPLKAGLIGFLAQILFVPLLVATVVVLVVTIIGIPLLALIPFALLALLLIALVGFTAVALQIGRILSAKFGWSAGVYGMTIVGILVVVSPLILARFAGLILPIGFGLTIVGVLVEYLAWTVGFGAVALARFGKSSQPI